MSYPEVLDRFIEYDRITDTLMWLSQNVRLTFVVTLHYKRKDGSRQFFHSEVSKVSNYYGVDLSRTIKRNANYYFVLDTVNAFGEGIVLRPSDVFEFITKFERELLPWFMDNGDNKTRLFSIMDDTMVIKGTYIPFVFAVSEYRHLSMIPTVLQDNNGKFKEGVTVHFNGDSNVFDLSIDQLLNLYQILKTTDMVTYASTMMNYVKTPPYGVNNFEATGLGSGMAELQQEERFENEQDKPPASSFLNNSKKVEGK
jgi:hypothetical protein